MVWYWLAAALCGYLLGSIPTGYLMGRLYGVDIRQYGSGATGGTNVLRTVGKGPAIITALVDLLKGTAAVLLGFAAFHGGWAVTAAGVAALVGHSYPVWLRFRGGKSVATGAGAVLPIAWQTILIALVLFVLVVAVTRYVSLGSILAALAAGILVLVNPSQPVAHKVLVGVAVLVILWRHRSNMQRLVAGTENKLGQKAKPRETH